MVCAAASFMSSSGMSSEHEPLVQKGRSDSFYFIKSNKVNTGVNRDGDMATAMGSPSNSRTGTEEESRAAEFLRNRSHTGSIGSSSSSGGGGGGVLGFLGGLFGGRRAHDNGSNAQTGHVSKPRKVPIKVEPKVFFANERTFLAWLHMAVTLASVSLAICAFAEKNDWGVVYGLVLMPVAIAFCVYALWLYLKRAGMIRRKDPGPYDDPWGPAVLSSLLGISIVVNFAMKVYEMNV